VAVIAMLFLVLLTTVTVAMFGMASGNVQSASNLSDVARAHGAAESGLRWIAFRFNEMARPHTTVGTITPAVMITLWPQIRQAIIDDMTTGPNRMTIASERQWTDTGTAVVSPPIGVEQSGATFTLDIRQTADPTVLLVTSTGMFGGTRRGASMTFKVNKQVKFAVVGRVPIQLGRNTIVEGPIAMATPNKFPPLLMLSDFTHFDDQLKQRCEEWNEFLQGTSIINSQPVPNHSGYDNRINVNNPQESMLAQNAGFEDINGDAFIDEYDLFVERFDSDGDLRITQAEFTDPSTGKLYEPDLFRAMDSIGAPMFSGDPVRMGFQDGVIDNSDGYAKLRGNAVLAVTAEAWEQNLAPQNLTINDMVQGTIAPTRPTDVAIEFGADPEDMIDLNPANFEQCANLFRNQSGSAGGAVVNTSTMKANTTLTAAMANGGTADERTPHGSTSWQATYRRPIFRNMTIRNCVIPKGLNALFDNCTFEGVTFVEGERNITTSSGTVTYDKTEGMNWSKRRVAGDSTFSNTKILLGSGTASSGQMITRGSQNGNNLRFNNCTMRGPVAGNYATAYTHFANSWEFTGATMFDNQWLDPTSGHATATIVSPQVNIELGSFTNPTAAPSTLLGVVVAGNIDIRGSSYVDGSIIVTGDGAGNTTLAYFGASDASTNPGENPEGGYGKLNIRYNPNRSLPDGIDLAIDLTPQQGTYCEVMP
jgi:Tfp pilus assembly protein PilX